MADVKLSTIAGGGGGLPQLAPDTGFPADLFPNKGFVTIADINAVGSLTTALSLSGKFSISLLHFVSLSAEPVTIRLTVDGVVVWNAPTTIPSGVTSLKLLGGRFGTLAPDSVSETIQCNTSLLLEIQTTANTSVALHYLARPIL